MLICGGHIAHISFGLRYADGAADSSAFGLV